jgi:hypothetical protein
MILWSFIAALQATPRQQPGAEIALYAPEQHDLYDGRFVVGASGVYQAGRLGEAAGWNHMANDASNAQAIDGGIEVDVDERSNTGTFVARLTVPEGDKIFDHFFAMEVTWK